MKKGKLYFEVEKFSKHEEQEKTVESPADQEINESGKRIGVVVNSPLVSIREYASDTAPVKDYLTSGEKVEIAEESSGFYMIRFGRFNHIGYVSKNFCREV